MSGSSIGSGCNMGIHAYAPAHQDEDSAHSATTIEQPCALATTTATATAIDIAALPFAIPVWTPDATDSAAAAAASTMVLTLPTATQPSLEIQSVLLPASGVTDNALHTVFKLEVALASRLHWVIQKTYADFQELHEQLKRAYPAALASSSSLHLPTRFLLRPRHPKAIERRRRELEKYMGEVLAIRSVAHSSALFRFLQVYAHLESYDRKMRRLQQAQATQLMADKGPE